jgi:hypothetical protein
MNTSVDARRWDNQVTVDHRRQQIVKINVFGS